MNIDHDTDAQATQVPEVQQTEVVPLKQSKSFENEDGIMFVSKNLTRSKERITYLSERLSSGKTATLKAAGLAINTAILLASKVRTSLGDVHQVVTVNCVKEEERD